MMGFGAPGMGAVLAAVVMSGGAMAAPLALPIPSEAPQRITAGDDVFLRGLADRSGTTAFTAQLAAAAQALPEIGERAQDVAAAQAVRDQARSRLFPTLGVDLVASRTIARDLQLPTTQVENLAPRRRNDVIGTVEQLVTDFGASSARIRAGNAGTDAARATLDASRNTQLLALVDAWYDVLTAQTIAGLVESHVARMQALAEGAAIRFERGVDSGGDVSRARSYLAAAQSQAVSAARQQRNAEARYLELFAAAPGPLARPFHGTGQEADAVRPELVAARAQARAAEAALDAARAD
ncbi:TolC family protein, partial [Polymorphobacter multimanifer]